MLARRVWRDDGLGATLGKPIAETLRVVGAVCQEARRAGHDVQQGAGAIEVVRIAGGKLKGEGSPSIVG